MLSAAPLALALALAGAAPPPAPVYRVSLAVDGPIMIASTLAIAVPTLLASEIIRERCPCDPSEVNRFDRGAIGNHSAAAEVASDVTEGLAFLAPPLLDLLDMGAGDALRTDVTVFAETLLVNGALVEIAKYTVQRPLPLTYTGDPDLVRSRGGYRSFYSGHTSSAFAALSASAMTIRLRYGERWWPWAVTAAVGASVAVERVAAGRHFPTDVIVGAAAGSAVGIAVPALHAGRSPVALVPAGRGLAVVVRLP